MGLVSVAAAAAALVAFLSSASLSPASAEEQRRCLNKEEQRNAIAERRAVPLAAALRTLRRRVPGEVIRARLCQDQDRLIYLLTVLSRDGKVKRATVDAANGAVVGER
jgi:uncharacterized membrane protein YkoI